MLRTDEPFSDVQAKKIKSLYCLLPMDGSRLTLRKSDWFLLLIAVTIVAWHIKLSA